MTVVMFCQTCRKSWDVCWVLIVSQLQLITVWLPNQACRTYVEVSFVYYTCFSLLRQNIVSNKKQPSGNKAIPVTMIWIYYIPPRLWTQPTLLGGSLVRGSTLSCKTEVWCWSHFRNYLIYISIHMIASPKCC